MEKIKNPRLRVIIVKDHAGDAAYSIQIKKKFLFWEYWEQRSMCWDKVMLDSRIEDAVKFLKDKERTRDGEHVLGEIVHEE